MKKILTVIGVAISLITLSSCNEPIRPNGYNNYIANNFEAKVYCTNTVVCNGCEKWSEFDKKDVVSITCTVVKEHEHYCVSYIRR